MVAGILEKSKRLRKAFFIVKETPNLGHSRRPRQTACSGALSRRGTYQLRTSQLRTRTVRNKTHGEPDPGADVPSSRKRRGGVCGDSLPRSRQPRRFALL